MPPPTAESPPPPPEAPPPQGCRFVLSGDCSGRDMCIDGFLSTRTPEELSEVVARGTEAFVGDGNCNNGTTTATDPFGLDLDCEVYDFDGGDCRAPGEVCDGGVTSCEGACVDNQEVRESWGNNRCDARFDCEAFEFDGGDCPHMGQPCMPMHIIVSDYDYVYDCNLHCARGDYIGDNICDANSNNDFNCEFFDYDGGDCNGYGIHHDNMFYVLLPVIIFAVVMFIGFAMTRMQRARSSRRRGRMVPPVIFGVRSPPPQPSAELHTMTRSSPPGPPAADPGRTRPSALVQSDSYDADAPEMFLCPITQSIMSDPVVAADGYTYEREAIELWLREGRGVSPLTNQPLTTEAVVPNLALRSSIREWVAEKDKDKAAKAAKAAAAAAAAEAEAERTPSPLRADSARQLSPQDSPPRSQPASPHPLQPAPTSPVAPAAPAAPAAPPVPVPSRPPPPPPAPDAAEEAPTASLLSGSPGSGPAP